MKPYVTSVNLSFCLFYCARSSSDCSEIKLINAVLDYYCMFSFGNCKKGAESTFIKFLSMKRPILKHDYFWLLLFMQSIFYTEL